jgi:hypothetical protein
MNIHRRGSMVIEECPPVETGVKAEKIFKLHDNKISRFTETAAAQGADFFACRCLI